MDTFTVTDSDLARELADGREEALEVLYDRYGRLAYSVAMRVLDDPGLAEDVVQEAFVKIWEAAARFDPGKGTLRTWLLVSVRRRSIDHLRGRHGRWRELAEVPGETPAPESSEPWHEVSVTLERKAVVEALGCLPPEQRQAVELAYFGGYSHSEISRMTRIPLGSVKGRLRLALEKMHSYLQARGLVDAS